MYTIRSLVMVRERSRQRRGLKDQVNGERDRVWDTVFPNYIVRVAS